MPAGGGAGDSEEEKNLEVRCDKIIGKKVDEERILAEPVLDKFVGHWETIISKVMPSEMCEALLKKYPPPSNFTASDPPELNSILKRTLHEATVRRDDRIVTKQSKLTAGLAVVGKVISELIKNGRDLVELPLVESLSDVGSLLADLQHGETSVIRNLILATINLERKAALSETKCTKLIFGDDLDQFIQTSKNLEKTVKELKAPVKPNFTKSSKNVKRPPRLQGKENRKMPGGQNNSQKKFYSRRSRDRSQPRSRPRSRRSQSRSKRRQESHQKY